MSARLRKRVPDFVGPHLPLGRKPSPDKLVYKNVGLTEEQWEWLGLWLDDGTPGAQVRELLERARKFWPSGPARFR